MTDQKRPGHGRQGNETGHFKKLVLQHSIHILTGIRPAPDFWKL